ncbi:MAG: hypothetical protein KF901_28245 [Myxococcales bacterium]|nr:hypothetical protein [Myxococcales bacterium]
MILDRDAKFREQAERFALRLYCEECLHFDPDTERCEHGFPVARHRAATADAPDAPLLFCKEHEIF